MSARSERWLVRIFGAATFATGTVAAAMAPLPKQLPMWALSSRVVYGLATALAVVVPLGVLLTLAVQTIVRGRVPTAISREGVVWPDELTGTTREALATLQDQVDQLASDVAEIAEATLFR